MTCAIAWFDPETGEYGVVADRQFTGSAFRPVHESNKLAQTQISSHGHAPVLLAFAGDYARMRYVQRWLEADGDLQVIETPKGMERLLLEIHAKASDGPTSEDHDPSTERCGLHVAAAHATGLYTMESYAMALHVLHTPAARCRGNARVACVGSAVEFVAGLMHGGHGCHTKPMTTLRANVLVQYAHGYLPQSVGCTTNALTYTSGKGVI